MMTALWPLSRWLRDVSINGYSLGAGLRCTSGFMCGAGSVSWNAGVDSVGVGHGLGCTPREPYLWRWRRLGHEDYRYAEIRRKHGASFPLTSLVWIFWLQAALLWVISWPLQAVFAFIGPLNGLDVLGIAMAVAGILIEALADAQLTRFRGNPANRDTVLDTGLWGWSRHPNYFGDFLMWWGYFVVAIAGGAPWWIILGPIAMSALLIHYSGAGLMEDTIKERRPGYADYVRRTSLFVPWPPSR